MPEERFHLTYGRHGSLDFRIDIDDLIGAVRPPAGIVDVPAAVRRACESPIDFPPLRQLMVGGDRVMIVLDRQTPEADHLMAGLWSMLAECGVQPGDVQIVQPAEIRAGKPSDPRSALPKGVREQIAWRVHDPLDTEGCGYLATSTGGERVYLTRDLLDADVVLCVGSIEFDHSLGYRGTLSSVYPGLSTAESIRKAAGAGHAELEPDSPRPLRELADEVGWLLGVQFVLQVVPAADGGVAEVLAGLSEPVFARGKQRLQQLWQLDVAEPAELVIAAVDRDAGGHSWPQVAAALDTARRIAARDGRILLLTELSDPPTKGIDLIRDAHTPHEAIKPVREQAEADRVEALQLALALDRANVYLLSQLDSDLVEELFMVPVASSEEALRVIEGAERCVVIGSAQHVFVRHPGAES